MNHCKSIGKTSKSNLLAPAVGVVENKFILVCGGFEENGSNYIGVNQCEVIDGTSNEQEKFEIDTSRIANAIQWSDNALWLTGSSNDKSTIIVSKRGYVIGPDLPEIRFGHCGVRINTTTAIIIAGLILEEPFDNTKLFGLSGKSTRSSWYFNIPTQTWIEGPNLLGFPGARTGQFACSLFTVDDMAYVAISNGKNDIIPNGYPSLIYLSFCKKSFLLLFIVFGKLKYWIFLLMFGSHFQAKTTTLTVESIHLPWEKNCIALGAFAILMSY